MKKFQYAISIVTGILVGALIALKVGNTITAILAGIVSASATTWLGSLQWAKAGEFAANVADKMGIAGLGIARGIVWLVIGVGKVMKWTLLGIKRIAIALSTDVNARKRTLAGVTVFALTVLILFLIDHDNTKSVYKYFVFGALCSIPPIFASYFMEREDLNSEGGLFVIILCDWIYQVIEDKRETIPAVTRMLYVRTGNALKIIAYPCVLVPWGVMALASNKTGASALVAMILSGLHLSIAHISGGIDTVSVNFWLSLIVAISLGAALGRKIYTMQKPAARRALPPINLRDQVALERH